MPEFDQLRTAAIDPGSVHCGMATFVGAKCEAAWETVPGELLTWVADSLVTQTLDVLVVEEFRLYPDKAESLYGSEMKTVEVIGVLRYLHAVWGGYGCEWVQQSASIKKPTVAQLRARKIASVAKQRKAGGHAMDAETHGYAYLLHREAQNRLDTGSK